MEKNEIPNNVREESIIKKVIGVGKAKGENRAEEAATQATQSMLQKQKSEEIMAININMASGTDLRMNEVTKITSIIQNNVNPKASISFDVTIDENLEDDLQVTIYENIIYENMSSELAIPEFIKKSRK